MIDPNGIIVMGGGPTGVINKTLLGILESWIARKPSCQLFGAIKGITGLIDEDLIDLRKLAFKWDQFKFIRLSNTPSAALRTTRFDIEEESQKHQLDHFKRIFDVLTAHKIGYLYFIGGEDSRKNTYHISEYAKKHGIKIVVIHVPKTIDNDLTCLHHCPGYASAAKFIVHATIGTDLDNQATDGIMIDIVMGRNTGWLAMASILSRKKEKDGPHLIYVPEITFSIDGFLLDIETIMRKIGRVHIVLAEGIIESLEIKKYITSLNLGNFLKHLSGKPDSFGHPQLSGTGILGAVLVHLVKTRLGIRRVRTNTFDYLQRCFPGLTCSLDQNQAYMVGYRAVELSEELSGIMITLGKDQFEYDDSIEYIDLSEVFTKGKPEIKRLPPKIVEEYDILSFKKYLGPLIDFLPETERLNLNDMVPKLLSE